MNSSVFKKAVLAAAVAAIPAGAALAHHSFASEFDRDQPFEIEGTVNEVEWTNPHGWLHVDVEEDGETVTYELELASPSTLMRRGFRHTDLTPGEVIKVTGFRARTRFHVGRAASINRENGEGVWNMGLED